MLVLIGIGGAIGAISRYLMGGFVHRLTPSLFPYGTFAVNVTGCLIFGLIAGVDASRLVLGPGGRAFLLIGVLGGFTTFSSFSFETVELARSGQLLQAGANIGGQVVLGLVALWLGYVVGRSV
jgi:CrcB protein